MMRSNGQGSKRPVGFKCLYTSAEISNVSMIYLKIELYIAVIKRDVSHR